MNYLQKLDQLNLEIAEIKKQRTDNDLAFLELVREKIENIFPYSRLKRELLITLEISTESKFKKDRSFTQKSIIFGNITISFFYNKKTQKNLFEEAKEKIEALTKIDL